MSRILLFVLCFLCGRGVLWSQSMKLTCEEAIKIALKESYTIHSYENDRKVTRFAYDYYKAMFKPRLDLNLYAPSWNESVQAINRVDGLPVYNSVGSIRFGNDMTFTYVLPTGGDLELSSHLYHEDMNTILASQDNEKLNTTLFYSRFALSFAQPVFTKNTLKENLEEAALKFQKSTYQYTRGQMDIIYQVTLGFYSLFKASRGVAIARERLGNSKEAFRVAKLKAKTGRIAEGEVMMAEINVSQDQAALLEAEGRQEREKDVFKLLIGLPLENDIDVMAEIKEEEILVDRQKALEEALKNRLELDEVNMDIALQNIEIDRAKRERRLKGEISGYYDLTGVSTLGEGSVSELFRSSINNFEDRPPNRGVLFTVSCPISDWGRSKAKEQKARVRLSESKSQYENMRNIIVKEVRDIVRTVEESQLRLRIHKKSSEMAHRNYKIFKMRFENGDISNQELSIERERLSTIQMDYLNAFISFQMALAELKRKTMWDFKNNRSYSVEGEWNEGEAEKEQKPRKLIKR